MRVLLLIAALLCASASSAGEQTLPRATYERLQQAQQLIENGDTGKALVELRTLLTDTQDSRYAQAVVLQTIAHAHIGRDDYQAAIPALQRSLALGMLPTDAQQRLRHNLAQLLLATEQFKAAVGVLGQYLSAAKKNGQTVKAEIHAMLGGAHLRLENYQAAIEPLSKAIALSDNPRENWYQALLGARHAVEDYKACAQLLHRMIELFPRNDRYWQQLAGIELTRGRHAEALAVMELAHRRGHLQSEQQLLQLAQLYLHRSEPFKAAQLIEAEIAKRRINSSAKNWRLAADAWQQARETERAIHALQQALNHGEAPRTSLRLARLYLEDDRPAEAADVLDRLLHKGKPNAEEEGKAWLLLGIAQHANHADADAALSFRRASRFEVSRKDAGQWLAYLETEVE